MSTITASKEQQVLDQVPKQLYIARRVARRRRRAPLPVEDPATGETLCEVADASVEDAKAALDAAVEAGPELASHGPARARRDPAPRVRDDHRAQATSWPC